MKQINTDELIEKLQKEAEKYDYILGDEYYEGVRDGLYAAIDMINDAPAYEPPYNGNVPAGNERLKVTE